MYVEPEVINPYEDEAQELVNNPPMEFSVRIYLTDKYTPGDCHGMPSPPSEELIAKTIKDNPVLAEYVKLKYQIKGNYYIYPKIKQIQSFKLTEKIYGYDFKFVDGKCCNIYIKYGEVYIVNGEIIDAYILKTEETKRPC